MCSPDRPTSVGDIINDQYVLVCNALVGHRIANDRLLAPFGGPNVVFDFEAGQIIKAEEITHTPPRKPAPTGECNDDIRLEIGGSHLLGKITTEIVDVLPVSDDTRELVGKVCHRSARCGLRP